MLQRFQKQPTTPTLYFVFDVLWADGVDITGKTVMERRSVLETIVKPGGGIQLGSFVEGEGKALFDLTKAKGMEVIWPNAKSETQLRVARRSSQGHNRNLWFESDRQGCDPAGPGAKQLTYLHCEVF